MPSAIITSNRVVTAPICRCSAWNMQPHRRRARAVRHDEQHAMATTGVRRARASDHFVHLLRRYGTSGRRDFRNDLFGEHGMSLGHLRRAAKSKGPTGHRSEDCLKRSDEGSPSPRPSPPRRGRMIVRRLAQDAPEYMSMRRRQPADGRNFQAMCTGCSLSLGERVRVRASVAAGRKFREAV